jgi:hypothetical protein
MHSCAILRCKEYASFDSWNCGSPASMSLIAFRLVASLLLKQTCPLVNGRQE